VAIKTGGKNLPKSSAGGGQQGARYRDGRGELPKAGTCTFRPTNGMKLGGQREQRATALGKVGLQLCAATFTIRELGRASWIYPGVRSS